MVDYKVVFDGPPAFGVEITRDDGSQSVRRFPNEATALMWVAEQEFHTANDETPGPRLTIAPAKPIGDPASRRHQRK